MAAINFCEECKEFTLAEKCDTCKRSTHTTKPSRYHPDASYAKHRQVARKKQLEEKGIL
jgi:rRNA maturation protein Nop10